MDNIRWVYDIPESSEYLVGFVCLHLAFKLIQGYDEQDRKLKIRQFQRFKNYQLFSYTQNLIPLDRLTQKVTEMDLRLYLVQLMFSKIRLSMGYNACDESTKRYFIRESKGLIRIREEEMNKNLPQ